MPRASDIYALCRAVLEGDVKDARAHVERICANEPDRSSLKRDLRRLLTRHGCTTRPAGSSDLLSTMTQLSPKVASLARQEAPSHRLQDVVLPKATEQEVQRLLFEHDHADDLLEHNLAPRMRLLLSGPPGTGKTILAGAIADALKRPFLKVEYGHLISGYLGATGSNITKLVDEVINTRCVLFLDEMETVLSERAGQHNRQETGEEARVVSTLLLALDRLTQAGRVFVIGATNHAELLDRAVRRRFELELTMPLASYDAVVRLAHRLDERYPHVDMHEFIPSSIEGRALSEIENEMLDNARSWVLDRIKSRKPVRLVRGAG